MVKPYDLAKQDRHSDRRLRPRCIADDGKTLECSCRPTPEQVEEWTAGARRMAQARRDAGVSLSAADLEVLDG